MRSLKKPFWLAETAEAHNRGSVVNNGNDKNSAPKIPFTADEGAVITQRVTNDGKPAGCIVVNTRAKAAHFQLTGTVAEEIDGFGVMIFADSHSEGRRDANIGPQASNL
jgi:hypothetical protein